MLQRTVSRPVALTGVGLHSGERVNLRLAPAPVNSGLVFRRTDLSLAAIKLTPEAINDTRLSSTIVANGVRVGTIEHLMSALAALGIDNLLIELDAPEIPIMDGSSLPFLYVLNEAKIVDQPAQKRFIRIKKQIKVEEKDKWVKFTPYEGFRAALTIVFDHPVFNRAEAAYEIDFSKASYIEEIARARTFGFMQEVEFMRSHNLGLGGNLNNAIVIDEEGVLNPEGLRYPNEFVRHKILDVIGDLYVLGHPIIGAFEGYKSGHAINNALLRALLADQSAYEWAEFPDDEGLPAAFHPVYEAA